MADHDRALLFWRRVDWLLQRPPVEQLRGVPFILALMLASMALGIALTFAVGAWFSAHEATAPTWGLTASEDQQLGGQLMLMPGMAVHIAVLGLILVRAGRASTAPGRAAPVTGEG